MTLPVLKPGDLVGGAHTPDLRRAERAIVRALADEFGKGQQCQVTRLDRFSIAIAGTGLIVEVVDSAAEEDRDPTSTPAGQAPDGALHGTQQRSER